MKADRTLDESMSVITARAIASADWLTDADEAAVALLMRLAHRMDDIDFPIIDGRYDNVTESLYMKTAAALGLTPDVRSAWEKKDRKTDGGNRLETLRKGTAKLRAV